MTTRTGIACAGVLGALLLAAACRQIVGIGDRSIPPSAACGLSLPEGDCRACTEEKCCAAAEACAGTPACKADEECMASCGGDGTCIGDCHVRAPAGVVSEYPALESCISANCAQQCFLSCGMRPFYVAGDGGGACTACGAANACAEEHACGQSPDCMSILACNATCSTLDCAAACPAEFDAGSAAFSAFANRFSACTLPCNGGQDWGCAGHVNWPTPKSQYVTLTATLADSLSAKPTPGANVALCSKNDPTCSQPLATATSDANGVATLSFANGGRLGGIDGYIEVSGPGLVPSQFFWGFPLTEPASTSTVGTLTTATLPLLLASQKVTLLPGHGMVGVAAFDCEHNAAANVQVVVKAGSDVNTKVFYAAFGSGLNLSATATDHTGIAFIANAVAGTIEVEVVPVSTGAPVSDVTFEVRDGGVTQAYAVPTPSQ